MNRNITLMNWWADARQGDVEGFGKIHHELYRGLTHYLFKLLKDEDVCNDLLQDLFIKLWERKEQLGPIYNVKTYIYKSARCMALNYLRKYKMHISTDDPSVWDVNITFSHEEVMMGAEKEQQVKQQLSRALNGLPKKQREVIFLRYFDGWSYHQISEVTGIRYQSVVNHVHRAVTQLRASLSKDEYLPNECRLAV